MSGQVKTLNGRYMIQNRIGCGSFGSIHSALDTKLKLKVAIKLNKFSYGPERQRLKMEYAVYRFLQERHPPLVGFVHCFSLEPINDEAGIFMVMEQLYKNLEQLFSLCHRKFPLKTIVYIALQCLDRIETLHRRDLIYRDVKPENFMIGFPGTSSARIIHLIDLGLVKLYRDPHTHEHIRPSQRKRPTGTINFMSADSHFNHEQSRRDDLESLAYMLLYLLGDQLPWSSDDTTPMMMHQPVQQFQSIGSMKQALTPQQLFDKHPEEFAEYLKYVRSLEFDQEPDYDWIREKFFKKLVPNYNQTDDEIFIWEHETNFYKEVFDRKQKSGNN